MDLTTKKQTSQRINLGIPFSIRSRNVILWSTVRVEFLRRLWTLFTRMCFSFVFILFGVYKAGTWQIIGVKHLWMRNIIGKFLVCLLFWGVTKCVRGLLECLAGGLATMEHGHEYLSGSSWNTPVVHNDSEYSPSYYSYFSVWFRRIETLSD